MLRAYGSAGDRLVMLSEDSRSIPPEAIWLDLLEPTDAEREAIEAAWGVGLPTWEEMSEIEESSRLYVENNALHMTVVLTINADTPDPATTVAAFVLTRERLITLRHSDPRPFQTFAARCTAEPGTRMTSDLVTVALAETIVDRLADLMQRVDRELDTIGRRIFRDTGQRADRRGIVERELAVILKRVGRTNRLESMVRDGLLSMARMVPYLRQQIAGWAQPESMNRIETLQRDIRSLSDYDAQINQEVTFLLEATLGLISIRQNGIIKVLSLAAVVFLPPTIVGTIYGMNFHFMPELDWAYGYPLALALMLASSIGCYWFFRWRGWL
jgi:magnesium transporter